MSTLARKISHIFIPGHTNNHKAKLLHPISLLLISLFLISYQIVLQLIPKTGAKVLGFASNISPAVVITLTNQKRAENGLPALQYNAALTSAAKAKGDDMLAKDYWAHVAPDGTQPWYFFGLFGYKYRYAGENLARDFADPQSAVNAWMASPAHRDNMLSTKYRDIGIAVVEGDLAGVDSTIIVQLFGTPLSDSGQIQIAQAKTQTTPTPTKKPTPTITITPIIEPEVIAQISPEATPIQTIEQPAFTSEKPGSLRVLFSPFDVTRTMSLVTVLVLSGVMSLDAWIVSRKKITRLSGRNFAHLAFLGLILSIILLVGSGKII